jgi:hypothetical protein
MLRRVLATAALLCAVGASAPSSPLIRVGTGPDDQSVPLLYADKAGLYKKPRGVPIAPADLQPVIDAAARYKLIPKAFPAATMICGCAIK